MFIFILKEIRIKQTLFRSVSPRLAKWANKRSMGRYNLSCEEPMLSRFNGVRKTTVPSDVFIFYSCRTSARHSRT